METFLTFTTQQAARDYRHQHGTGGWIFSPEDPQNPTVLFPSWYSPIMIFHHPFAKGQAGDLIGAQ